MITLEKSQVSTGARASIDITRGLSIAIANNVILSPKDHHTVYIHQTKHPLITNEVRISLLFNFELTKPQFCLSLSLERAAFDERAVEGISRARHLQVLLRPHT